MKIPTYARYDYCAKRACEFLEEYNISSYPIDVEKIITDNHWGLTPYSLLMEQFNCDRETVIRCLRSKDGYTQLDKDNYSIAYNDDPTLGDRKRFTLMHEIGHIYLNHLIDFDITLLYRGSLSQDENKVLENEANAFARNVLTPVSLVQQLTDKSPENISAKFGITYHAASTRQDLFRKDYEIIDSVGLLQRMRNIYHKFYNKTTCSKCHAHFLLRYRSFCPICGSKGTLKWGDGLMDYREYETTVEGFVETCIRCGNKKLMGNFCQICGAPVRNYCTSSLSNDWDEQCRNSKPLPGNARYCPDCGSMSLFYQHKILTAWNIEYNDFIQKQELETKIPAQSDVFMSIPDPNDELPFPDFADDELPFN